MTTDMDPTTTDADPTTTNADPTAADADSTTTDSNPKTTDADQRKTCSCWRQYMLLEHWEVTVVIEMVVGGSRMTGGGAQ